MSRKIFVLLVVVAVLATIWGLPSPKKCDKNEEWTECGTMCPAKCGEEKPQVCPAICIRGCQCKRGYLRNSKNKCVLPCDCDC